MRRRTTIAVALAALVLASGCLGFLSGPLTFAANEATASDAALQESGYEKIEVRSSEVTRTFSAAGQSKNVTVTNWAAMYERTVDVPVLGERRAAVFSTFSTPEVEVLGETFNPIEKMSDRDIAMRAQQQYQSLSIGQAAGTRTLSVLGHSTEVTKFEGTATLQGGEQVEVFVHVTKVNDGSDYVVAMAIYPQKLDGEQQRVNTLLEGLEHQTE